MLIGCEFVDWLWVCYFVEVGLSRLFFGGGLL